MSVVAPLGYSTSRCGYCARQNDSESQSDDLAEGSRSFGAYSHQLTCQTYQELIDRGWRRSGKLLYKPDLKDSCCKQYTIRLDAHAFRPDSGQRSLVRRLARIVARDPTCPSSLPTRKGKGAAHFDLQDELSRCCGPASCLSITFEAPKYSAAKYALFRKYQMTVHNEPPDKVTSSGFRRFLCDSPLADEIFPNVEDSGLLPASYGTCHAVYRLEEPGRIDSPIIALAVLDILPRCVSSVYFAYDPTYGKMSLGKFSALSEISLVQRLSALPGLHSLKYYYMGYYIHTCPKMRYKGQYAPSELLDPASYGWYPLSQWLPLLEQASGGYVDARTLKEKHCGGDLCSDLSKDEIPFDVKESTLILVGRRLVRFKQLIDLCDQAMAPQLHEKIELILEGICAAGVEASRDMIWFLSEL